MPVLSQSREREREREKNIEGERERVRELEKAVPRYWQQRTKRKYIFKRTECVHTVCASVPFQIAEATSVHPIRYQVSSDVDADGVRCVKLIQKTPPAEENTWNGDPSPRLKLHLKFKRKNWWNLFNLCLQIVYLLSRSIPVSVSVEFSSFIESTLGLFCRLFS